MGSQLHERIVNGRTIWFISEGKELKELERHRHIKL